MAIEFWIYIAGFIIVLLPFVFFTVEQQTVGIVETFGGFSRIAKPGLNLRIPLIQSVAKRLNMRIQQLDVLTETKTQDNVFVKVCVSVQFRVLEDKIYEAYYKLEDPEQQIKAFIFDVVRACVPKMGLDDVFERKDDIAEDVKRELADTMSEFGYGIVKTLVTDIVPDEKVKASMNDINAAKRERMAASERGEAEKVLLVKRAEAEAESAKLQGVGIADQRRAIIEGLRESVMEFQESIKGTQTSDIMNLVMMTQYFDMLKVMGEGAGTHTILLPHSPGAVNDVMEQLRNTLISSAEVHSKKSS